MVVAGTMLVLVVLVLPLLAPGAAPCLRCWPDAPPYVHYDVRLLLGAAQPGGAAGLERLLSALILEGDPGVRIMERERLEREAGKLFYRLDQIITRNRQDPGRLMKEAVLEKQNFTRRLRAASAEVRQQVCSASCGRPEPFDLSECDSCERLQARCRDQRVCAGAAVILAVGLSLLGLVLGAAVGRRARPAGGTGAEEGPVAARTEPPTEQGDGAPADLGDGAPAEQGDGAPADLGDGAPTNLGNGAPAEQGDGAPADLGDGAPTSLGNGAPAEQGDGAATATH
ncbi:uncharacterized protein LOC123349982 [Mauremys mutica]|uniref:uncharacterized protein LOC123349982 n=1 Tax=Mauremys mutica TaxID=74926 RepID=UPI001D160636|nr:uncharacterized protein LOC123349982 [Mauremys mutica]